MALTRSVSRSRGAAVVSSEAISARGMGDLFDGAVEGGFVGFRGRREAAELAHELDRGGADFLFGRGRLEIEQGADVAAHWRRSLGGVLWGGPSLDRFR